MLLFLVCFIFVTLVSDVTRSGNCRLERSDIVGVSMSRGYRGGSPTAVQA